MESINQNQKNMQSRYKKITALVIALKNLFPNSVTVHDPTEQIDRETLAVKDIEVLFESLVHSITLINKLYRRKDSEGSYISQREDYATALMLVSPLFAAKTLNVEQGIRKYYHLLSDEFGFSISFTWKDVQLLTGKSKTSCNRILQGLQGLGLLRKSGIGYKRLYKYELVAQNEKDQTTQTWESALGDWNEFKGSGPL